MCKVHWLTTFKQQLKSTGNGLQVSPHVYVRIQGHYQTEEGLQTEDENMHAWVCVHERVYGYVCAQVCVATINTHMEPKRNEG